MPMSEWVVEVAIRKKDGVPGFPHYERVFVRGSSFPVAIRRGVERYFRDHKNARPTEVLVKARQAKLRGER